MTRERVRNDLPPQRIQLSYFPKRTSVPRSLESILRHTRLDQSRTDRVHSNVGSGESIRTSIG